MELHDTKNITDNLPDSSKFRQKIATMNSQLPSILDDFKKYYVFFNKTPDYPEYQQMFQNIQSNLNSMNSDLFMLSNDVQSNTDKMNKTLFKLDILIKEERKRNRQLKSKLGIVEHKIGASSELISDYTEMYDSGYLRNWALFLSILVVGGIISKVYRPPAAAIVPQQSR
jgi:peptidoglycan hydrolase CwlO-like protein